MNVPQIQIVSAAYHRNGVCGEGFWAILFDDAEHGRMVASLFEEPGVCAVYKLDLLTDNDIAFGSNSWRGDWFEDVLRPALAEWKVKNDKI